MSKQQGSSQISSEFDGLIKLYWEKLSRTERQIAMYILQHEDSVAGLSIHALAKSAGCGVASVMRLSKTLGFKGFADMKFQIEKERLLISKRDVGVAPDDPANAVKQKVLQFDQSFLEKCVLGTSNEILQKIADSVAQAEKLCVIGCGAASGIAQAGAALFMSLGIMALSVEDAMLQTRTAAFLRPGDVLFVLSYSGYSKEGGDAMLFAREAGATNVLITSCKDSLLGKYADFELYTAVRNHSSSVNYAATSISQLVMLQLIQAIVQQRNIPRIRQKRAELRGHGDMKYYDVKQEHIYRGRVRIVGEEGN